MSDLKIRKGKSLEEVAETEPRLPTRPPIERARDQLSRREQT